MTVKTIKKKQKHKGRGTVRTVTKQVPNDSFFNFFNPVKGENTHKQTNTNIDVWTSVIHSNYYFISSAVFRDVMIPRHISSLLISEFCFSVHLQLSRVPEKMLSG